MQFGGESSSQRNSHQGGSSNRDRRRLDSKDLRSVRRLGKGLSGYLYETTWEGNKYVRKDFPLGSVHHNVFEKEANALLDLVHSNVVRCPHYTVGKSSCSLLLEYVDDDLQNIIQKKIEAQGKGNRTGSSTTLHSRLLNIDETRSLMSSKAKEREITGVDVRPMKMPENEPTAPFEVPQAVDVISKIATGLKYLHDNGIVHGDLKPQNVLVGNDGIVKLVDFGLVETKKRIKLASKRTRHFEILMWKAPERFEKLLGLVTEDSDDPFTDSDTDLDEEIESSVIFTESRLAMADVYSFGLVCSQVLGGNLMYSNLSLTQLREQRMHKEFRPQLPSTCPEDLRSLIFSSMEREPRCRPTFTDIWTSLKAFQSIWLPRVMEGADFMKTDISRSLEPSEDHGALEMVLEPISQVRQALETIKHVRTMSSDVRVNKKQCKRLANRFSVIGERLKSRVKDTSFNVGNASDGSNHKDYHAFDELLIVLRKGEALVSSFIDSKGIKIVIISVVYRTENQESFKEIHKELNTLKAKFYFEIFSEFGQVKDFESSSGVPMTNALAKDADQDFAEMHKDMVQINNLKSTTETDMEEVDRVVLEKSGLLGPRDELPSYLQIDLTDIKIEEPVVLKSKQDKSNELGWTVVHFSKWIGFDFAAKVFKSAAIDVSGWNNKQLLMEVGSLANLRHPHIVRLVGFGRDAEQCVFLMELMDSDLRNFMNERLKSFPKPKPRPFKRPEELDIITQIAKGMHYMHTQQYAHGNLKCSHILVKKFDDYLQVKITGLRGSQKLSKGWDAEAFRYASQTRRPQWTAPEAIDLYGGKEPTSALLKKSDVYSFGMTCYEVVTGKYPFDGITEEKLLQQIHAGVRPELPGDLDEDLKGIIKKCWDHDPNERPEFGELILLLNYIRSKKPIVAWNKSLSKDMVLSFMKSIPQVHGVLSGLRGMVRHGNEHATDFSHDSSVWGEKGDGEFQRSDSALTVPEHLRILPDKLDKVRCIGKGASSTVYEATWLGCTFAVKVFNIPSTHLDIRHIQNEVDFLITLSCHPCIAQMVGLSVDSNQRCYIVMELMNGNLTELIKTRMRRRTPVTVEMEKGLLDCVVVPFELHEALSIISKIALGMAFLHSKGVMHRDLKSGNVLVNEHGKSIDVKLADFGMSLHELASEGHGSYLGIGTGFWRAPELFPGGERLKKPDLKAADVYSFAITCYEVLTGKKPFAHLLRIDFTPVVEGERPALPAQLHPGLKALVQQCWHADPVKRPNFTEICEELQKIRQSLPS